MPTIRLSPEDFDSLNGADRLEDLGPILHVQIGLDPAYTLEQSPRPSLPIEPLPALIDTGASESGIDSGLAVRLQLPVVERSAVAGIHGSFELNYYLAQIYVPSLDFTIHGKLAGVNLAASGLPYSALIGRDFLRNFTMTYNGRTGQVTLNND